MIAKGPVVIAAGGTGGHLFPAESLAVVLAQRKIPVVLMTDERAQHYGANFPAGAVHVVASATPTGGSPVAKARSLVVLARGAWAARALLKAIAPRAIVGFGGYPTVPPLLAAGWLGIPAILHEQNAVMGRANRFLSGRVALIASGFPGIGGAAGKAPAKHCHTGNPLRPAVLAAAGLPFPEMTDGRLRLLVTGGSQGARVMADVVPPAIALLDRAERARIDVTQQARGEDEARVRAAFDALEMQAHVAPFFADLPGLIAQSHLVVARAGASTVSELAAIGRPAVLVPFPHALDQDQAANAAVLSASGAAVVIAQKDFTPQRLADELRMALRDGASLARRAAAAKSAGVLDAAERLADLVETLGGQRSPPEQSA